MNEKLIQAAIRSVQVSVVQQVGADTREASAYVLAFEHNLRLMSPATVAARGGYDVFAKAAIAVFKSVDATTR